MSTITIVQYSTQNVSQKIEQEKNKEVCVGKEKAKSSLFTKDMNFYVEDPKKFSKTLKINKQFRQINIQRWVGPSKSGEKKKKLKAS